MKSRKKIKLISGFTLIELLLVISVITLFSLMSLISARRVQAGSRDAKRITDLKKIQIAMEMYYEQYGHYPMLTGDDFSSGQTCANDGWTVLRESLIDNGYLSDMPDDIRFIYCSDMRSESAECDYGAQEYVLGVVLETARSELSNDFDGKFFSNWYDDDVTCEDDNNLYCVTECQDNIFDISSEGQCPCGECSTYSACGNCGSF